MRRFVLLAVIGLTSLGTGLRARQTSSAAPQATFRATTNLIQIDVSVLDRHRQPVRGLTKDDFTLLEDGQPRPIAAVSEIDVPAPPSNTAAWVRDVAPDVATNNVATAGRLVVILFDRSIPPGYPQVEARRIAKAAVDQLGPDDLAAVISTGKGLPQNFTSDHERLLAAIDHPDPGTALSGDAREIWNSFDDEFSIMADGSSPQQVMDGSCYCGLCELQTIEGIANTIRDVPRRRKTLLYIGSSITVQATDGDCGYRVRQARTRMLRAVDAANLTISALDPAGLDVVAPLAQPSSSFRRPRGAARDFAALLNDHNQQATVDNLDRQNTLGVLPEHTGGRTVLNTNDAPKAVQAIFQESASYYLIGFRSADPASDGSFHKIEVKVNRKGLTVRSRQGFYAPDAADAEAAPRSPSAPLTEAIAGVVPESGIPLGVTVAPFAVPGSPLAAVAVVLGVDTGTGTTAAAPGARAGTATASLVATDRMQVLTGIFDRIGRPAGSLRKTIQFTWPAGRHGYGDVITRLDVPPGSYEVRIAAQSETSSRTGSVYTWVDVPAFGHDALSLSGAVVTVRDSATASPPMGRLAGVLPAVPTTRRTFTPDEHIALIVRAYRGSASGASSEPVRLRARIEDADGHRVSDESGTLNAALFLADQSADYEYPVPIATLTPGPYVLNLEASLGKSTVERRVRFEIQPAGQ